MNEQTLKRFIDRLHNISEICMLLLIPIVIILIAIAYSFNEHSTFSESVFFNIAAISALSLFATFIILRIVVNIVYRVKKWNVLEITL